MKADEREQFAVECADRLGKVLDVCKVRYNRTVVLKWAKAAVEAKWPWYERWGAWRLAQTVAMPNKGELAKQKAADVLGKPLADQVFQNVSLDQIIEGYVVDERKNKVKPHKYLKGKGIDIPADKWGKVVESLKSLQATVYLSADPVDIATASTLAAFSSCHNLVDGDYGAGAIAYALAPNVLIAYTGVDEGRPVLVKTWRQMVFAKPNARVGVFLRQYPREEEALSKTARALLMKSLGVKDWKVARESSEKVNVNIDAGCFPGYVDDIAACTYPKELGELDGTVGCYFRLSRGICLLCGEELSDRGRAICCNGNTFRCDRCEIEVDEEEDDWYQDEDGYRFCASCYFEIYCICRSCDREIERAKAEYDKYGDPFCRDCYSEIYTFCAECDEEVEREKAFPDPEYDDAFYCEWCYKKLFVKCVVCQGVIERDDAVQSDDGPVCQYCAPQMCNSQVEVGR